ncbi:MAG: DUF2520 domain-containing protein [Reichenbachiella sp.]
MEKVTIIGTGKVAQSFIQSFISLGQLNEVYGRNELVLNSIKEQHANIDTTTSLDFRKSSSTIFIICVSDSAIELIAQSTSFPIEATVVHTSGTVNIETLAGTTAHFGIFYPLQTFSPVALDSLKEIPLLIEASNKGCEEKLLSFAQQVSNQAQITTTKDRQRLHIAAVFASNFTNRMLFAAETILKDTNLSFDLLKPLVQQSIKNVFDQGAQNSLTGPAQRKDKKTVDHHTSQLNDQPALLDLYKTISSFIENHSL